MVLPEPPVKVASKPPVRVTLSIVRFESVAWAPPLLVATLKVSRVPGTVIENV